MVPLWSITQLLRTRGSRKKDARARLSRESSMDSPTFEKGGKYAWFVLLILGCIFVQNQWCVQSCCETRPLQNMPVHSSC